LINRSVDNVDVVDDQTLLIGFDNLTHLRLPLGDDPFSGEKAILTAEGHVVYVWSSAGRPPATDPEPHS
jgi:hypothetical protein